MLRFQLGIGTQVLQAYSDRITPNCPWKDGVVTTSLVCVEAEASAPLEVVGNRSSESTLQEHNCKGKNNLDLASF